MKKLALIAALWMSIVIQSAVIGLPFEVLGSDSETRAGFVMPSSLTIIETEAFEGTAAVTVTLQNRTVSIGDGAFANAISLRSIYIPDSVEYIGKHAFDGVPNLTIRGEKDSYASAWARENNVAFIQEHTGISKLKDLRELLGRHFFLSVSLYCMIPSADFRRRKSTAYKEKSMRPQDRPELYPINYRFP